MTVKTFDQLEPSDLFSQVEVTYAENLIRGQLTSYTSFTSTRSDSGFTKDAESRTSRSVDIQFRGSSALHIGIGADTEIKLLEQGESVK